MFLVRKIGFGGGPKGWDSFQLGRLGGKKVRGPREYAGARSKMAIQHAGRPTHFRATLKSPKTPTAVCVPAYQNEKHKICQRYL